MYRQHTRYYFNLLLYFLHTNNAHHISLENGHESFTMMSSELVLGAKANSTVGGLMVRVMAEVVVKEVVELLLRVLVGAETERTLHRT